ncbi:hypothetical protein FHG87_005094 [Trinorchestia longiramus]|nr:hypothetical protein FHG87_005094 [Trinorchestia longiramus]
MSAAGFEPGSSRSKADSLTSRPSWWSGRDTYFTSSQVRQARVHDGVPAITPDFGGSKTAHLDRSFLLRQAHIVGRHATIRGLPGMRVLEQINSAAYSRRLPTYLNTHLSHTSPHFSESCASVAASSPYNTTIPQHFWSDPVNVVASITALNRAATKTRTRSNNGWNDSSSRDDKRSQGRVTHVPSVTAGEAARPRLAPPLCWCFTFSAA